MQPGWPITFALETMRAVPKLTELAERAGHSRPSMSLDVYSHVMPADEIASERFSTLIGG